MVNRTTVKRQLKHYLSKAKKVIPIERAYIVGSWARGKAKATSDVDLLLLSSSFNGMDADERLRILYRQSAGIDFDLHIHAVTPDEFAQAGELTSLGVMRESAKVAITVNN